MRQQLLVNTCTQYNVQHIDQHVYSSSYVCRTSVDKYVNQHVCISSQDEKYTFLISMLYVVLRTRSDQYVVWWDIQVLITYQHLNISHHTTYWSPRVRNTPYWSALVYLIVQHTACCIWSVISSQSPIPNLIGLFPTKSGKRDLENLIIDWDLRNEEMTFQMQQAILINTRMQSISS